MTDDIEITPEQDEAELTAGYREGFQASTETPSISNLELPQPAPTEVTPTKGEAPPVEPVSTEPVQEYVQLTKAEHADLLKLRDLRGKLDEGFGRIGHIQQLLQDFKQTGSVEPITEADLDPVFVSEFPDLAKVQVQAINTALARIKPTLPTPAPTIDTDAIVRQVETRSELKTLTKEVPDWEAIVGPAGSDTEFRKWAGNQSKTYYDQLFSSNDGIYLAGEIKRFKAEQDAAKQPKAETPAKPNTDRTERLKAAAPLKGKAPLASQTSEPGGFRDAFTEELKAMAGV